MSINTSSILLAELSTSLICQTALDREATDEVVASRGAQRNSGRFTKVFFPDAIAPVRRAAGRAGRTLRELTVPGFGGSRILPVKLKSRAEEGFRRDLAEFEAEVEGFMALYDSLLLQEAIRLGRMFDIRDYPAAEKARDSFRMRLSLLPFPASAGIGVIGDLADEARSELEAMYGARVEEAGRQAASSVARRLLEMINRMAETLAAPGKVFRDSLVENIRGYLDTARTLNIVGDPRLEELIGSAERYLLTAAEELRGSPIARTINCRAAQSILDKYGAAPGARRAIVEDEDEIGKVFFPATDMPAAVNE